MTIDKDHIIANLKEVYDPEMQGINVYDLGLIYDIIIDDKEGSVDIIATLTSAFCPFADDIISSMTKACYVENVRSAQVEITFEPPFSIDSVPEATKLMMGW